MRHVTRINQSHRTRVHTILFQFRLQRESALDRHVIWRPWRTGACHHASACCAIVFFRKILAFARRQLMRWKNKIETITHMLACFCLLCDCLLSKDSSLRPRTAHEGVKKPKPWRVLVRLCQLCYCLLSEDSYIYTYIFIYTYIYIYIYTYIYIYIYIHTYIYIYIYYIAFTHTWLLLEYPVLDCIIRVCLYTWGGNNQ